jgi:hypothetical protein
LAVDSPYFPLWTPATASRPNALNVRLQMMMHYHLMLRSLYSLCDRRTITAILSDRLLLLLLLLSSR